MSSQRSVGDENYLILEVANLVIPVMTGIYSKELNKPQPLRFDIRAWLDLPERYDPDTPLSESKNYMDLKHAAEKHCPRDQHIVLIEAVADALISGLMAEDKRVARVEVKIVKLAISERGEDIGITMSRTRG
ncbi:MAG: dihydroneopterin aldolase [Pseudomonadota bacterium]